MSAIGKAWQHFKNWRKRTKAKDDVSIDQYPKENVRIGIGGSTKISADVTTSSSESSTTWQKVENNGLRNLQIDSIKYSGSSCSLPTPVLVINDVDKSDDGFYQLSVTTINGTINGPQTRLNVFGDPVDSLPIEERNFLRYYLLCQTIASESVRLYFSRKVPDLTLAAHLNSHKKNLQFSYWKCTPEQLTILFPAVPGNVQSSTFDFTLLYKLIRNTITPMSTPTRGWGSKPLPGDITEEDDIERIRQNRNVLAHNTEFKLKDSDFQNLWTDLSQAIVRLSFGSLSVDVINLSKQKLDQHLRNEIFENLKIVIEMMKGEVSILHQDMHECKERIQMMTDSHIPSNIRRTQLEILKVWTIEDELYYDETRVYQVTKDIVESHQVVGLVGGPGCGKTAMVKHIALKYEQNGWEVVPVYSIGDIVQYGDRKLKQVFLLDDIFGIFDVNMSMFSTVNKHENSLMHAINQESKLLFTCRTSVYNEAMKLESFVLENIADLDSKSTLLNDFEKENILSKHCRYRGVPEEDYSNLSLTSSFIMFPLLCQIFSTQHEKHASVRTFFEKPFTCLIGELDQLEQHCPQQYSALVLCVINNNKLSLEHIPIDGRKEDVFNTCGINLGTSDKQMEKSLSYLTGTYLVMENRNYITFIHDTIYEIVAYHYGKKNPLVILKYMSSSFIASKVTMQTQHSDDFRTDLSIVIEEDHYDQMAERLYRDIQSFELFDVFMKQPLSYPPFLKVFMRILRNQPFMELQSTLFYALPAINIMKIHNDTFKVNFFHKLYQFKRQDLLIDHIVNFIDFMESDTTFGIRAISWIIYYGQTRLLQEIICLVLEHNDSTDIIFGSDITKQTRSLTLGCYSGDPDMVTLILKYVNTDCVNYTSLTGHMKQIINGNKEDEDNANLRDMVLNSNMHRTFTPLTAACDSGYLSVVKCLLSNKAKVNQCDDDTFSPLQRASFQGHYEVVKYLIQEGAHVNQRNKFDYTPLYYATIREHENVKDYLIQEGANTKQAVKLIDRLLEKS